MGPLHGLEVPAGQEQGWLGGRVHLCCLWPSQGSSCFSQLHQEQEPVFKAHVRGSWERWSLSQLSNRHQAPDVGAVLG